MPKLLIRKNMIFLTLLYIIKKLKTRLLFRTGVRDVRSFHKHQSGLFSKLKNTRKNNKLLQKYSGEKTQSCQNAKIENKDHILFLLKLTSFTLLDRQKKQLQTILSLNISIYCYFFNDASIIYIQQQHLQTDEKYICHLLVFVFNNINIIN